MAAQIFTRDGAVIARQRHIDIAAQPVTSSADVRQTAPGFGGPAYRYIRTSDRLPSTDEANAAADPMVRVKLFNPTGAGTWYITGHDPETGLISGAATIHAFELGDSSLPELVALRLRFGLRIERDIHWRPVPLSEIIGKEWGR